MSMREFVSLAVAALVLFITAWLLVELFPGPEAVIKVSSFEDCVAAGNPVMESYPRQCRSADGQLFVEDVPAIRAPNTDSQVPFEGCVVAGCSGQLCVSPAEAATMITTCEFRPEYACYKTAVCERQADDQCGWTHTSELEQCLANPPEFEGEELQVI